MEYATGLALTFAGQGKSHSDSTLHVAGPAGNTFPFALVANGYRITQLIDEFDPVVREVPRETLCPSAHPSP